ncbi:MAG TPA: beta-ketoacyl synthase N-terminal-like domain-containing protein, partial [Ktedonobacteraceae bacterium]|nr:beta-ketoacyl synthase N-terminal-like domain-containing protein [Ktedonobacteraceae bacterium]
MAQRIVITGLGVLSPIGNEYTSFWQALISGQVGTGPIQAFDTSMFEAHVGGEVRNFEPAKYFHKLDPDLCGRTTQLAVAAARMAADDAGISETSYDPARIGVFMGTTMGNASVGEDENSRRIQGQPAGSAELASHYAETFITAAIAQELDIEGPCHVIPTACAAGNYAIGWGMDMIRDGLVDVAVVGGADALSRGCFAVFHRLGGMAREVCQPFDLKRTGMLVSEGAGVLILEDYENAVRRG